MSDEHNLVRAAEQEGGAGRQPYSPPFVVRLDVTQSGGKLVNLVELTGHLLSVVGPS